MTFTGVSEVEGTTLNEKAWVRRAQAGDAESFRRLVESHAAVVWTVINRMISDPDAAEDCFQNTVIRFWKGLPAFHGDSKLSTWLYRIAYRVCLDEIESKNRHGETKSLEEEYKDKGLDPVDPGFSGQRIENEVAARDAVEKSMSRLKPQWRALLTLFYWRGLSIEEVGMIMDLPQNTVKVYLHRARAKLREILEDGGYPSEE